GGPRAAAGGSPGGGGPLALDGRAAARLRRGSPPRRRAPTPRAAPSPCPAAARRCPRRRGSARPDSSRLRRERQVQAEHAAALGGLQRERSAVGMHDLLHVREPDARATLARREERVEDSVADLGGDAGGPVPDRGPP